MPRDDRDERIRLGLALVAARLLEGGDEIRRPAPPRAQEFRDGVALRLERLRRGEYAARQERRFVRHPRQHFRLAALDQQLSRTV